MKDMSFDEKVNSVISKGFSRKEQDIIITWYGIESTDEDISTEKLMALTADENNVDIDRVVSAMVKFQKKYDILFKE